MNEKKFHDLEEYYKIKFPNTKKYNKKENPNNLLIYILTYNMKGKTPSELDIPLLFPKDINKFDLYIISTQECLRSIGASIFNDSKEEWITALENFFGNNYIKIIDSNLNAIHLCIFAKKEKSRHFHDLRNGEVKTGYFNFFGNKGAVSASMKYLDKHILFIGCHLAAGHDELEKRKENLFRISNSLSVSLNEEANKNLKIHKKNLQKTYVQPKKTNNDIYNDNTNKNWKEITFGKKMSESQVIVSKKSLKFEEDLNNNNDNNNKEQDDKKLEENDMLNINFNDIKEVESKKDEEDDININININDLENKNNKLKKNELFEKIDEPLNETVSSIMTEGKMNDKKIDDYDFVIISGDLNYRINFDNINNIKEIIQKNEPQILWDKDQLTQEIKQEYNLKEGIINFMPTYKYKENKDEFDYERIPGWTDRILYKSKKLYDIMLCEYNSIQNIFLSDHKPVYAVFKINFKNQEDIGKNLNIKDDNNNDKECFIF